MSAVATPRRPDTLPRPTTTLADRLLAAVPLASIYIALCMVYVVGAWKRVTPWLFTDELEMTQLSRSIAATGRAARRGSACSASTPSSWRRWLIRTLRRRTPVGTSLSGASVFFPRTSSRMVVGAPARSRQPAPRRPGARVLVVDRSGDARLSYAALASSDREGTVTGAGGRIVGASRRSRHRNGAARRSPDHAAPFDPLRAVVERVGTQAAEPGPVFAVGFFTLVAGVVIAVAVRELALQPVDPGHRL